MINNKQAGKFHPTYMYMKMLLRPYKLTAHEVLTQK